MSDESTSEPLEFPFGALSPQTPVEVAPGVILIPIPVPFPPGAVNCAALAEPDGWTLVDTGLNTEDTKAAWETHLRETLGGRPVLRVFATHHHPDHLGLAGWFQTVHGAELWTTRTAWLFARMLHLDDWSEPPAEMVRFHARCGYDDAQMARWRKRAMLNFTVSVAPMPLGVRTVAKGASVTLGGRRWRVAFGHGHAPDHAVLLSDAETPGDPPGGLALVGDTALPKITPNIGVYATEPEADPLGDWMESCARLGPLLGDARLILPGHGDPYRGAARRLALVHAKHARGLDRLAAHLADPHTVVDCWPALYRREIGPALEGLATVETLAHLHRLRADGRAERLRREGAPDLWRAARPGLGADMAQTSEIA